MAAEALRVALLARPGLACDRLRGVLDEAGAQRVLEADPTALELPALIEAAPQVVLVALDPATEDALGRFDDVLFNPAIDVIYEEAELTASREGWDVARWQRHLVAKLQRHGDVLPPGREPDHAPDHVDRSHDNQPQDNQPSDDQSHDDLVLLDAAMPAVQPAVPAATSFEASLEPVSAGHNPFDPVLAESSDDGSDASLSFPVELGLDFTLDQTLPTPTEPDEFAAVFDPVLAETTMEPGLSIDDTAFAGDAGLVPLVDPAPSASHVVPDALEPAPRTSFGELSLEDGPDTSVAESHEDRHRFKQDLTDLEQRISSLELVDDTPVRGPEQARGAVLVLAGIGGPDAVRQLLGALPTGFARPVLVQQRLDGARYDKLVAQMQRATALPVQLAEPGQSAQAGSIYILPAAVGVDIDDAGIRFIADERDVLAALPSADSAVLLLSGSDPGQVDAAMKHSWAGALVAGQAADGCYDAAASNALAARGGDTAPAIELAQRLAERWS